MEQGDRAILQHTIAKRVGKLVSDLVSKEPSLDEDITVEVFVETPSCYYDNKGEMHVGRVISVFVDISSHDDEEDE